MLKKKICKVKISYNKVIDCHLVIHHLQTIFIFFYKEDLNPKKKKRTT